MHLSDSYENRFYWKGLKLTEKAAKRILILTSNHSNLEIKGLKLSIKKSGCAGLSYKLSFIEKLSDEYLDFSYLGAHLYVSIKDMPLIDGTEIDYINEGLNQSFKFKNPKVNSTCGCGESFNVSNTYD